MFPINTTPYGKPSLHWNGLIDHVAVIMSHFVGGCTVTHMRSDDDIRTLVLTLLCRHVHRPSLALQFYHPFTLYYWSCLTNTAAVKII